jgi:predicted nucleic acid-binding protein
LAVHFRTQAAQVIDQFIASPQVEVVYTTPQLLISALALYKRMSDKQWGLVDCISFVIMRERGISEALTPDHHFNQAGFQALFVKPQ